MPRKAREKSKTGIYAVLIKGKDPSRKLFYDRDDYREVMWRLNNTPGTMAFALCDDRICMVIEEWEKEIGSYIKPITVGYARYYGKRYGVKGGIFERRFRSVPIETPEELAAQLACVHSIRRVTGKEGRTGYYQDDKLYIPDSAMKLLGSRDIYDEAMKSDNPITPFFAINSYSGNAAKKAVKKTPKKPEIKKEPEKELPTEVKSEIEKALPTEIKSEIEKEIPKEPVKKKKNKMPSWLL